MNTVALVLSLLVMQDTQRQVPTWPVSLSANVGGGALHQGDTYRGQRVEGGFSAEWYVNRPLVDDDTPYALQVYLQKLDRLSLGFGGDAFSAKNSATLYEHSGQSMGAWLSGLRYRGRMVFGGGLHYGRINDRQVPAPTGSQVSEVRHLTESLRPWITLGVRNHGLELRGAYLWRAYFDDGVLRDPSWGQVEASLRLVREDFADFRLAGYTLTGGGGISAMYETFPTPCHGIWFGLAYDNGQIYGNSLTSYERGTAEVGLGWWLSSSTELQFSIIGDSAGRPNTTAPSLVRVLGNLGLVMRIPGRQRAQDSDVDDRDDDDLAARL